MNLILYIRLLNRLIFLPQLAMTCLQLHTEMALQASRALESGENMFEQKGVRMPANLSKGTISIPFSNMEKY